MKINRLPKYVVGENIKDTKRDLVILECAYIKSIGYSYKYKCNKCGFDSGKHYKNGELKEDLWVRECDIVRGRGCSCCANRIVVQGINDMITSTPKIKEILNDVNDGYKYTYGSTQKILFKCKDCGQVQEKTINDVTNYGFSCTYCNDGLSYGHKFIGKLLNMLNITNKQNLSPYWCNFHNPYRKGFTKGEYDFVIEEMKLIIEVDGGFHRVGNNMANKAVDESIFIDNKKDELAIDNGYIVVRIRYDDDKNMYNFVDNILSSKLPNYLNLTSINWDICNEFAHKSIIKLISDYYMDGEKNIHIIKMNFNIGYSSTVKYLKIGRDLGLNDYDENIARHNNAIKINIYKDNEFVATFDSCKQLSELSICRLGEYLAIPSICRRIDENHKLYGVEYKGFTIKRA